MKECGGDITKINEHNIPWRYSKVSKVYNDEVVVKSESKEHYLVHLKESLKWMRKHNLKINLKAMFGLMEWDEIGWNEMK